MWLAALGALTLGCAHASTRLDPLVDSPAGRIRGLRSEDGEDYSMFLGIPYGQIDEGNPFGASIPQPKLETVFDADTDSPICPQVDQLGSTIDCLHLNLYVPDKASSGNRLAVLVWIYGGSFDTGFANRYIYGPKYLVRHDVILVTFNYRVGLYGFLCLDTPEIPGNQGLKDQLLALRWIKENIESFGGDVNRITLMGESAGSASVEYHLISKKEKLFNQVILQSGSMFVHRLVEESDASKPLRIAEHLGFITEDVTEAVDYLRKMDTNLVIAAASELAITFKPCAEKEFEGVESFMTDHPINLNIPKIKSTPVLIGFNSRENLATFAAMAADEFKNLNVFGESFETIYNYDQDLQEMEDIVRRFYIGDEEMSEALRWNLTDFRSDFNYIFPVQVSLKKFFESGVENVFYYMFSYSGNRNLVKKGLNVTIDGAAHADEIGYLFDVSYLKDAPSADDQLIIDQITILWTNFAKYGEPTPETSELLPIKWTPITEESYTYLEINRPLKIGRRPYNDRMAFWELFLSANKNKLKGYRD